MATKGKDKKTKQRILSDIVEGDFPIKSILGTFFIQKKSGEEDCDLLLPMTEDQVKRQISIELDSPNPSAVTQCVDMLHIQMDKNPRTIWDMWRKNMEKKFDGNKSFPLLYMLFNEVPNLFNALSALVQGQTGTMIILYGVPKAGKSIIMEVLMKMFSNLYMVKQLNGLNGQFGNSGVGGKLLVCADDLGAEGIEGSTSGVVKTMVTGGEIIVNEKHKQEYIVRVIANFVYGCNTIPYYDLLDTGMHRRVGLIKFNKRLDMTGLVYEDLMAELLSDTQIGRLYDFLNSNIDPDLSSAIYDMQIENILKYKDTMWEGSPLDNGNPVSRMNYLSYEKYRDNCKYFGLKPFSKKNWERLKEIFDSIVKKELL